MVQAGRELVELGAGGVARLLGEAERHFPLALFDAGQDGVEEIVHLHAKGVEFVSEPKKEQWGTFAIFKDPDGNIFLLSSK